MYLIAICAWFVPGAGHWLLGLRGRGTVMCLAIGILFLLGLMLGSVHVVDPYQHKAWFAAQILCGVPAIVTAMLEAGPLAGQVVRDRGFDYGLVYAGVAGLLNLLCILDAIYRAHESLPALQNPTRRH